MSYVLINGKRYYKDDRTGRTVLDNVSQAEADRRAQGNPGTTGTYRRNPPQRTTGAGRPVHAASPWRAVLVCTVVVLFLGAFVYNHFHVSAEEQAIADYMNAQQAGEEAGPAEAEPVSGEEVPAEETPAEEAPAEETPTEETPAEDAGTAETAASGEPAAASVYLMPESAGRYLEASEIEGRGHEEVQQIINEIYARHGREFQTQENRDYFSAQDWYEPIPGKTDEEIVSEFNEFEKANVELLCRYL